MPASALRIECKREEKKPERVCLIQCLACSGVKGFTVLSEKVGVG